jgi:Uma2 family endonuclease
MIAYTIDFTAVLDMTDEQFYQLCQANPEVKLERNAKGDLLIMSPTGGKREIVMSRWPQILSFGTVEPG